MREEKVVERCASEAAPYLQQKWAELGEHPLVGEARMIGLVGALELVPNKPSRTERFAPVGAVGTIARDFAFTNGLVMRAVRDALIISPPLVVTRDEIDEMVKLIAKTLDDTYAELKAQGRIG